MKNIYNNIVIVLIASIFIVSCEDNDDLITLSPTASTGVANFSVNSIVLDRNNEDAEVLTITFQEPDLGYSAGSIGYQLLFDLADGDFSAPQIQAVTSGFSTTFTAAELNQILINLGANPGAAIELLVKIETVLSSDTSLFSEQSSLQVTPYASTLDLSSRWGLVGDATINGWDGPDMPFYQSTDGSLPAGTFVAYVTLTDGFIKVRADNDWTINYGDVDDDGVLEPGTLNNNIAISAGTYKILFNENSLSYSVAPYSWGLVGDATINGWDGPDMPLTYDPLFDNWQADVTLVQGNMKIRFNNDWAINYGDVDNDGVLEPGTLNNNIAVNPGTYIITFNPITLEYSIKSR
ncbi:SusE domain-containing protein [Aquimarina sp. MMG016]|uniref:SusE domain-containing protein n=1 Tax=Aquimarina sp. MMG016 TaxID=2822690 RepID=UPI001B39F5C8|nr:SusE domain-containing protein [Aquimarina sp. MMG016]MBQ4819589.1 SusE domain-containing protein [Aquimarina sp. MMG016]